MRIAGASHLTYCTNIHPGEDLAALRHALATHVVRVKAAVCPDAPFGVGLRLAARASTELAEGDALAELHAWLEARGLYVFTLNGFPYGSFHGTRVKARVYEPDWRSPERLVYSNRLADQLAVLLPDGANGSISTVPGAWKAALRGRDDVAAIVDNLLRNAAHLHALHERTGKTLALALEPEPGCMLETIAETRAFFTTELFGAGALARFAALSGVSRGRARDVLERHLGVCVDTCHAAVEFEDPGAIFDVLADAGIAVKKLQLSSGLRVAGLGTAERAALAAFAEDVYLHQAVEQRADGELRRYTDLPDALTSIESSAAPELRIHFHVPIFHGAFGALHSTQAFLLEVLTRHAARPISEHLEVETYTWDVLPPELRLGDVAGAITRELQLVLRALGHEAGA